MDSNVNGFVKVAQDPFFSRLESKLIDFLYQAVGFGSLHLSSFLSALASNNAFRIKLVKMWPGRTPHVVVGTLKISLDRLKKN